MALQVDAAQPADVAEPRPVEPDHMTEVGRVLGEPLHRIVRRGGVGRGPVVPVGLVQRPRIGHRLIVALAAAHGRPPRARYARCHGPGFVPVHPEPAGERVPHRAGLHPLLRPDVRDRHHPGHPHHPAAVEGARRGRRPGRGRGHLGGAGRHRGRPDLLRPDHAQVHPAPLVRRVRRLGRRAGHLGRHRAGCRGRRLAGPPHRGQRQPVHGRGGARAAGSPGDRPGGQLLQPGTVRRPDHAALGTGDRAAVTGRPGTRSTARSSRPSCTS